MKQKKSPKPQLENSNLIGNTMNFKITSLLLNGTDNLHNLNVRRLSSWRQLFFHVKISHPK